MTKKQMKSTMDITGWRVGKLVVLHRVDNRKYFWLCKCDCGNYTEVRIYDLFKGYRGMGGTKSCGCGQSRHLEYGEASFNRILKAYKQSAKTRKLEFLLSKEDFKRLIIGNCHYCGIAPARVTNNGNMFGQFIYNGIDRVDNNKGYIIDNCVTCCEDCNRAKLQRSEKEFLDWIKKVYEYKIRNN